MADWQPSATRDMLQLRAQLLHSIRQFFAERYVLEVDTPLLSAAAIPSPALDSIPARYTGPGFPKSANLYLHTSPEFFMKRLLAAGSGDIFQLCHVFRDGEFGNKHNPEFTLLEWYRVGFSLFVLIDEVEALLWQVLGNRIPALAFQRISYQELFARFAGVDGLHASAGELKSCLQQHGQTSLPALADEDVDSWKDLVLTHIIEPQLQGGWCVYHYPASQAALARLAPDAPGVAERFEFYIDGLELANGFCELVEASEQRARFEQENAERDRVGKPRMPLDENFLRALDSGMPECAGVAVGFDRLVMLAANAATIQSVMPFGFDRI